MLYWPAGPGSCRLRLANPRGEKPMNKRIPLAVIACAVALVMQSQAGIADRNRDRDADDSGRDNRVGFVKGTGRVEPHARYSNDVAYEFGTVSVRGNKKVPYVERCYWTAKPGFFILPTDIRQVCTRYTLENTPE
jgi:hypothetical protein